MNYDIVELPAKTVAGLTIRTRNSDPNMTADIGGLWQRFYSNGVYQSVPEKVNEYAIGLYHNYENGADGFYDVTVCCETQAKSNIPAGLIVLTIPSGKYARFIIRGGAKEIGGFWQELWQMDLNRRCSCDFEEYRGDEKDGEIHIYISVN